MPIYTRAGDGGETSLFGGRRVLKSEPLVDLYGSVDDLNSHIGLIAAAVRDGETRKTLEAIQKDLFAMGAALAGARVDLTGIGERVTWLERDIDRMELALPKLTKFILPGGSVAGASAHVARAICRATERKAVAYQEAHGADAVIWERDLAAIVKYLNRLSDHLFVLARSLNAEAKAPEVVWDGPALK